MSRDGLPRLTQVFCMEMRCDLVDDFLSLRGVFCFVLLPVKRIKFSESYIKTDGEISFTLCGTHPLACVTH